MKEILDSPFSSLPITHRCAACKRGYVWVNPENPNPRCMACAGQIVAESPADQRGEPTGTDDDLIPHSIVDAIRNHLDAEVSAEDTDTLRPAKGADDKAVPVEGGKR